MADIKKEQERAELHKMIWNAATDLKDGVYTVSVIIERVRPLDFVLN